MAASPDLAAVAAAAQLGTAPPRTAAPASEGGALCSGCRAADYGWPLEQSAAATTRACPRCRPALRLASALSGSPLLSLAQSLLSGETLLPDEPRRRALAAGSSSSTSRPVLQQLLCCSSSSTRCRQWRAAARALDRARSPRCSAAAAAASHDFPSAPLAAAPPLLRRPLPRRRRRGGGAAAAAAAACCGWAGRRVTSDAPRVEAFAQTLGPAVSLPPRWPRAGSRRPPRQQARRCKIEPPGRVYGVRCAWIK